MDQQHHPKHSNGWHFDNGPRTYLHDEPHMTADEYQSYRMMWIAVYGHYEVCDDANCALDPIEPPRVQPKQIREV